MISAYIYSVLAERLSLCLASVYISKLSVYLNIDTAVGHLALSGRVRHVPVSDMSHLTKPKTFSEIYFCVA